jgi:thiol:disulfide interchange protein DsbD
MATRLLAAALLAVIAAGGALPASAAAPPRAASPPDRGPKVSVALISEPSAVEPGTTFWVGLRQRIAPGWHTYWINPGDSGEPPTITWSRASPPDRSSGPGPSDCDKVR